MLLFIAFQLSAQVLCTIKDTSVSRLLEEGFDIVDEVIGRDSHGLVRLTPTYDIAGRTEEGTEVVPSWLFGDDGGTTVVHIYRDDVNSRVLKVRESDDWWIHYYATPPGMTFVNMLQHFTVNELCREEDQIYQDEIIYFSAMNDTGARWAYVIYARDTRFDELGERIPLVDGRRFPSEQLSFRQISNLLHTIIRLTFRHAITGDLRTGDYEDMSFHLSLTDPNEIFVIPPKFPRRYQGEVHDIDLFMFMGFIMHGQTALHWTFARIDNRVIVRQAFYRDSVTPDPVLDIRFRPLSELLGEAFAGYDLSTVSSHFQEWLRLITGEYYAAQPNADAIPKITDLIDPGQYVLK
jgi:hypothetical protein